MIKSEANQGSVTSVGGRRRADQRSDQAGLGDLTRLLDAWARGEAEAAAELLERVYGDLRRLAARELSFERAGCSIQATELVHEVYLRLEGSRRRPDWQDRGHFFAVVSRLVRQVLVDLIRARRALKRTAPEGVLPMELDLGPARVDLLALDQALERLTEIDRLAVRVVELRYLCGFSVDETAQALEIGRATVVRKWRAARAFLFGSLNRPPGPGR